MIAKVSCLEACKVKVSFSGRSGRKPLFLNFPLIDYWKPMSVGRSFVVNELKRLEFRFHPDGPGDEQAIEHIRAAIRALTAKPAAQEPAGPTPGQARSKAS